MCGSKIKKNHGCWIDTIGNQASAEMTKLEKLETQIKEQEAKMTAQQTFIDETNADSDKIRVIGEQEITNEWNQFSVTLDKMIDLQSPNDPLKSTLTTLKSNIKGNADEIMRAL